MGYDEVEKSMEIRLKEFESVLKNVEFREPIELIGNAPDLKCPAGYIKDV